MVSNMTQWSDVVLRSVRQAATRSFASHRGFVDLEDLQQEGYEWILRNKDKVDEWLEMGRDGVNIMHTALYHAMHQYTMKERYRKDGTKPGDYYFYQRAVIVELLPAAFDDEPNFGSSPSDLSLTGRSGKALSEGGDLMAMLADVRSAYRSLNDEDKAIIKMKYGTSDGIKPDEELAQWFEIPLSTMNRKVTNIVKKMAKYLGSEPVHKPRKAMSNAQAQHITKEQE